MKIAYLESQEVREGTNPAYQLQPQMDAWIMKNLEERYQKLVEEQPEKDIQLFLTMRTYKKMPIFAFGYIEDENSMIIEAWYFRMKPSEDKKSLEWALDRAPVKEIFT